MTIFTPPTTEADYEIAALSLQLEELDIREKIKKGKYSAANVPDVETAFENYHDELQAQLQFWEDLKFAHSIANAVNTDGPAIAEILTAEAAAHENRQLVMRMSDAQSQVGAPAAQLHAPTEYAASTVENDDIFDRLSIVHGFDDDNSDKAGPSLPYVKDQTSTLGRLASKAFQCVACTDSFRLAEVTQLQCGDQFCSACLKVFIMRGVLDHDLALLPPRCCGTPVHRSVIASLLNDEEMDNFVTAEEEKATDNNIYCSNESCGRFFDPKHILAGSADCPRCGAGTCAICRSAAHDNDCPEDPAIQETLALGIQNKWQRCYSCHAVVAIETGCNHVTYVLCKRCVVRD